MDGGHLSCPDVTIGIMRPTRGSSEAGHLFPLIWPFFRMGLALRSTLRRTRWSLTPPFHPYPIGRYIFCGAFRARWPLALRGILTLESSDFPPSIVLKAAARPAQIRINLIPYESAWRFRPSPRLRALRNVRTAPGAPEWLPPVSRKIPCC